MELYWILRLPHLRSLFNVQALLLAIASIMLFIFATTSFCANEREEKINSRMYKTAIASVCLSYLFCILALFLPTKEDLAIMYSWDAIKSDSVQEVIDILKDKIK